MTQTYGHTAGSATHSSSSNSPVRVLVIGSNPSSASPDTSPFHPNTRSRKILDQWFHAIDCTISFANVVDHPTENNRPLRVSEIRRAIPDLSQKIKGYNKIVALGNSAGKALDIAGVEHFKAFHPSGMNRKLNDKTLVDKMIAKLTSYIQT